MILNLEGIRVGTRSSPNIPSIDQLKPGVLNDPND
jgi:hypothetical protein